MCEIISTIIFNYIQILSLKTYLHGAINKFPDFFVQVFKNCRRLLKIHYVIAIHLMRWLTNDFTFKWTAAAGIGIHPTKAWLSQLVNFKNAIWAFEEWYAIKFCFKLSKKCHAMKAESTAMTQRPRDRVPNGSMLTLPDPRRPEQIHPQTFDDPFFFLTALAWSTCTGFPLDRLSTRNALLRF